MTLEQDLKQKRAHITDLESKVFQSQTALQILKVTAEKGKSLI